LQELFSKFVVVVVAVVAVAAVAVAVVAVAAVAAVVVLLLVSSLPSAWPGLLLLLVSGVSWSCSSALSSARGCSPVFAFSSRPRVSVLVSVSGLVLI